MISIIQKVLVFLQKLPLLILRNRIPDIHRVPCQVENIHVLFRFQKLLHDFKKPRFLFPHKLSKLSSLHNSFINVVQNVNQCPNIPFYLLSLLFFYQILDRFTKSSFLKHRPKQLYTPRLECFSENSLNLNMQEVVPLVSGHKI